MLKDTMTNIKKNKDGLTPKQKIFYDIIKDFIKMNKFAPSYEELKQLSGLNSKSVGSKMGMAEIGQFLLYESYV